MFLLNSLAMSLEVDSIVDRQTMAALIYYLPKLVLLEILPISAW